MKKILLFVVFGVRNNFQTAIFQLLFIKLDDSLQKIDDPGLNRTLKFLKVLFIFSGNIFSTNIDLNK